MLNKRTLVPLLAIVAIVGVACSSPAPSGTPESAPVPVAGGTPRSFPPAPVAPTGPLPPGAADAIQQAVGPVGAGSFPFHEDVSDLGAIGDVRVAWILADMLRLFNDDPIGTASRQAVNELTGQNFTDPFSWGEVTDLLIAWDIPAFPDYVSFKQQVIGAIDIGWKPFFDDEDADIDWRFVSWGGVGIDDRPLDQTDDPCPGGCIPALNDPAVTDADGGDWYPDDRLIFGVDIEGESRAYPKNQMEVHEMVNDTLGGRRIAIPYCTLCGSAQVWFTDTLDEDGTADLGELADQQTYEFRTSGLLSRSNKVMYEFHTKSVFDTFAGDALSGPLQDAEVSLQQGTVVVATWAEWKAAHPDTTIIAEDGGIGRRYEIDPLGGRDDNGPIFPIGDTDARLRVQEPVLGVILGDGTTVAFPVDQAKASLALGQAVTADGIDVTSDGAGLIAMRDGEQVASHQAFWFAWSQFHPDTTLWLPPAP